MERKIVSDIMLTLLLIGMLTLASNIQPARAEPNTTVYLVPSEIILYTNEVSVGYRFSVTAWVSNVTDLFGYQAALYYDNSTLDLIMAFTPFGDPEWVFYGLVGMPAGPSYRTFDSWGYGLVGYSMLPPLEGQPWPHFTGTGKLAVFEFEVIASPQDGNLTSDLIISHPVGGHPAFETKLKDSANDPIEFTATDGYYVYMSPPPLPGDLNKDGKVDIDDIIIPALAFGSYPTHPRWDPIADITGPEGVPDDKVDIDDVVLVALHFGEFI